MASRSGQWWIETACGLVGLIALVAALAWILTGARTRTASEYPLRAVFAKVEGLDVGGDVRLGGVPVGRVVRISLDPSNWQAVVDFSVADKVKLPVDSGAVITSDSLLGGKYVALTPGGSAEMLKPGQLMADTQGSISLEALLSKFIFSVTDSLSHKCAPDSASAPQASRAG